MTEVKNYPTWDYKTARIKAHEGRFGMNNVNVDVFRNNIEIFHQGGYPTESGKTVQIPQDDPMIAGTKVYYEPIKVEETSLTYQTETDVVNDDALHASKELIDKGMRPAVLNLASRFHACGGYHKGSRAQEEGLSRVSTLSRSLYQYFDERTSRWANVEFKAKLYPMNIRYGGIYSPEVTVFRDATNGYKLLDSPYHVGVISVAALNFRVDKPNNNELIYMADDGGFNAEGEALMRDKIRTIYRMALTNGHDALVLGAFGCGAFRLRSDRVAPLFKEVLQEPEFQNKFRFILFAILERNITSKVGANGKFAPFYEEFA